jgi:hypothetical protein
MRLGCPPTNSAPKPANVHLKTPRFASVQGARKTATPRSFALHHAAQPSTCANSPNTNSGTPTTQGYQELPVPSPPVAALAVRAVGGGEGGRGRQEEGGNVWLLDQMALIGEFKEQARGSRYSTRVLECAIKLAGLVVQESSHNPTPNPQPSTLDSTP